MISTPAATKPAMPSIAKLGFAGDYAGTMPGNPLPSTMDLSMVF